MYEKYFEHYRWRGVDLGVDLVNTAPATAGRELLRGPDDLAGLLARHEISDCRAPTERDIDALHTVRRQLLVAVNGESLQDAVPLLNDVIAESGATPRGTNHDAHPWHVDYHFPGDWAWRHVAGESGVGLVTFAINRGIDHLRVCAAHDCARVFADYTKNSTSRYCHGRGCANRARVRRHRASRATM